MGTSLRELYKSLYGQVLIKLSLVYPFFFTSSFSLRNTQLDAVQLVIILIHYSRTCQHSS